MIRGRELLQSTIFLNLFPHVKSTTVPPPPSKTFSICTPIVQSVVVEKIICYVRRFYPSGNKSYRNCERIRFRAILFPGLVSQRAGTTENVCGINSMKRPRAMRGGSTALSTLHYSTFYITVQCCESASTSPVTRCSLLAKRAISPYLGIKEQIFLCECV